MGNCCKPVSISKKKYRPEALESVNGGLSISPAFKKKKKSSLLSTATHHSNSQHHPNSYDYNSEISFNNQATITSSSHRPKSLNDSKHPLIDSGNTLNMLGTSNTPLRTAVSYENKLDENNVPHIIELYPEGPSSFSNFHISLFRFKNKNRHQNLTSFSSTDNSTVPADNARVSTLFLPKASKLYCFGLFLKLFFCQVSNLLPKKIIQRIKFASEWHREQTQATAKRSRSCKFYHLSFTIFTLPKSNCFFALNSLKFAYLSSSFFSDEI